MHNGKQWLNNERSKNSNKQRPGPIRFLYENALTSAQRQQDILQAILLKKCFSGFP